MSSSGAVLCTALLVSALSSGCVFGWSALVPLLKADGAYADECSNGEEECSQREVALGFVFSVGFFCFFASRLPFGIVLDAFGPKPTVTASFLLGVVGALLFAKRFYVTGFALLASGSPGAHIGAMHISNLSATRSRTVLGHFNTGLQLSSLVFPAMAAVVRSSATTLSEVFAGYAVLLVLFAALSWCFVQPWRRFVKGDVVMSVTSWDCRRQDCLKIRVQGDTHSSEDSNDGAQILPEDNEATEDAVVLHTNSEPHVAVQGVEIGEGDDAVAHKLDGVTVVDADALGSTPSAPARCWLLSREMLVVTAYKTLFLTSLQLFVLVVQFRQERSEASQATQTALDTTFNALSACIGLVAIPFVGPFLDSYPNALAVVSRAAAAQAVATNCLVAASVLGDWPLWADLPSYVLWASQRVTWFVWYFAEVVHLWGYGRFGTVVGVQSAVASGVAFGIVTSLSKVAFASPNGLACIFLALCPPLLLAEPHLWLAKGKRPP